MAILKKGLRGEPVRRLQAKLGLEADGIFGPRTEQALRQYQQAHRLTVDGIAGPETFAELQLYELILLRPGSRGKLVQRLQEALGLKADGIFGPGTERALKKFQQEQGLTPDGVAGPLTLARMDLFTEVTEEVAAQAVLPADYDPIPPLPVSEFSPGLEVSAADAPGAGKPEQAGQSVWDTVKGWFQT